MKTTLTKLEKFTTGIQKELVRLGAKNISKFEYEINTKAGILCVSLHDPSIFTYQGMFSVFCAFEDVDKVKAVLPKSTTINNYSGKWNFHNTNPKECITEFKLALKDIISHD